MKELASPKLISDSPEGFGLNNLTQNRKFYQNILTKKTEVLEESDKHVIFRAGGAGRGWYIAYDKQYNFIYYAVCYERMQKKLSGVTVTQTLVWRKRGVGKSEGLASRMFFDVLLKHTGTIMSDRQQTKDGREFWINMLGRAYNRGIPIGIVNFNTREIIRPAHNQESSAFLEEHLPNVYGNSQKYEAIRFLIGPVN